MKLELNVVLIIQFFSLFVKLKLQIKKIEQDLHDYHDYHDYSVVTVARGPVPRDRPTYAKNARQPTPFPSRPRHGEGQAIALR